MVRRAWNWCLGMLLVCCGGASVAHAQHFTSLPIPSGPRDHLVAADINDSGVIVGSYGAQAFLLQDGVYTFFAVSGADQTGASGINNLGQVVGSYVVDVDPSPDGYAPEQRAFLWQSGSFTTLPQVGATTVAYDINDAGVIVGGYFSDTGGSTFIAGADGIQTLAVPGQQYTVMTGINNEGVLVGQAFTGFGPRSNWRYVNGAFAPLTLPTAQDCPDPVVAKVNDAGTVVGECVDTVANSTFVANGTVFQVLRFPGAVTTFPGGINGQGAVVGYYWDSRDISAYVATFPSLSDPVPDLLDLLSSGSFEATDFESLSTDGRPVHGVAADGVARVIVKLPATAANQLITVRLLNDHEPRTLSSSAQEDGALLAIDAQTSPVTQLIVNAVATSDGPTAFLIYRAPKDFPREGVPAAPGAFGPDDLKASRRVFLEITPQGESSYIKAVEVVRPPVFLIHGLWSGPRSWFGFLPLRQGTDARFRIDSADYSGKVTVTSTVPPFSSDDLPRLTAASLGVAHNSPFVKDDMQKALERFRLGVNPMRLPMAAAQTDVVGHSLGGVVARTIATLPDFLRASNFNAGSIHKLVTIDTPHLGSPLAAELLATRNTCLRTFIASTHFVFIGLSNFSLVQATLPDDTVVDGAVRDLVANPLSPALQRITASAMADVPTAFVAGEYERWSALDGLGSEDYIKLRCGSEWLASRLTSAGWPTIFNGERNDAIVGWNSQINGVEDDAVHPFSDKVHSAGTRALGFAGPSIQDGGPVPVEVTRLLNTPVYASTFFRPKP